METFFVGVVKQALWVWVRILVLVGLVAGGVGWVVFGYFWR
jgi:hypothetical protein